MIISVWGSYGIGKSLFSTVLGKTMASKNKKVLIIYSNIQSNDTFCFYPNEKYMVSMGEIFQNEVDEEELFKYMVTTDDSNLLYLTYTPGENIYSYPIFVKINIINLLSRLEQIFDYVIVDCSSDLNASVITLTALEISDTVIRLMGANGRSNLYFLSCLPIISDSRYNVENHIKILSKIKVEEPYEAYEKEYGNIKYRLFFDKKIYKNYLEGEILKSSNSEYKKIIEKIVLENFIEEKKASKKEKKPKKRRKEEIDYGSDDE